MKKLVSLSRLDNPYDHITENQYLEFCDRPDQILNRLHTTVFATRLAEGISFDDVVQQFAAINAKLGRAETLCVLDAGAAWYSAESGSPMNADYMRDRTTPLLLQIDHDEPLDVFYRNHVLLMGHLTRSVLGFTENAHAYGRAPLPARGHGIPQRGVQRLGPGTRQTNRSLTILVSPEYAQAKLRPRQANAASSKQSTASILVVAIRSLPGRVNPFR